jgi:hypothetical protein
MGRSKSRRGAHCAKMNTERAGNKRALSDSESDGSEGYENGTSSEEPDEEYLPEQLESDAAAKERAREKRRAKKQRQKLSKKAAALEGARMIYSFFGGASSSVPIALSQTRAELPEELRLHDDLPVSPLFKIRRWFRISWQYAAEYRKGESGDAVVRAVAAQRSSRHRDTSDPRARQAEARMEELAFAPTPTG